MTYQSTDSTWTPPFDLVRERALDAALQFHRKTDTDDPAALVATAREFLAFLQGSED